MESTALSREELMDMCERARKWAASPSGQLAFAKSELVVLEMEIAHDKAQAEYHATLPIMHRPCVDVGSIHRRRCRLVELKRLMADLEKQIVNQEAGT